MKKKSKKSQSLTSSKPKNVFRMADKRPVIDKIVRNSMRRLVFTDIKSQKVSYFLVKTRFFLKQRKYQYSKNRK